MFISRGECAGNQDDTQVWGSVPQTTLFTEFRIDSQQNNNIYVVLNLDHALRALRSIKSAKNITMRLTKKSNQAYLTLDFRIDLSEGEVALSQDIPVRTLQAAEVDAISEPVTNPTVQIMMPVLKDLKPIIDRMQKIGTEIDVEANMNRTLIFKVSDPSGVVDVATYFKNQEHPHSLRDEEGGEANNFNVDIVPQRSTPDEQVSVTLRVEAKKLQKVMHAHIVTPRAVVLGMMRDTCMVVHVDAGDGAYLTYYLSVIA
ncbi:HUS1 checkpoint protein [Acrasis kona]|uniref:Checkpoint protein n=1 Tax=Acrasis kona TaxID=1008807 RepID=A0AAW2YS43_9EUKA